MKYYLIVGEASGDLHASNLMLALQQQDNQAEFRFFGGDLMTAVGGVCVKHYQEMAYMGFIPVLLHLPAIMNNMKLCKEDIVSWNPDVVVMVDYPGFNLSIAKFLKRHTQIPIFYYISPKIWAWKEYRIKNIKRDVDELFSILPFEVPFFEDKHHYLIHYVGNPTADEVHQFRKSYSQSFEEYCLVHQLNPTQPIIALLAGSRIQEIKDNLPSMIKAIQHFPDYQAVLAGAPSIDESYYHRFLEGTNVQLVKNETYPLLAQASAALVTSGTATLETALFNVPQIVCYKTPLPHLMRFLFQHVIKVKYISLVNLIADKEVVPELFADRFAVSNIVKALKGLLPGGLNRQKMLEDYQSLHLALGSQVAHVNTAKTIVDLLSTLYSRR